MVNNGPSEQYWRKTNYSVLPGIYETLTAISLVMIIAGLGIILIINYFDIMMRFKYPEGDAVNFAGVLFLLGGILLIVGSIGTAIFLLFILLYKLIIKKERIHLRYEHLTTRFFLILTLGLLFTSFVLMPVTCQYIDNSVQKDYKNFANKDVKIETNSFQILNNDSIDLGTRNLALDTEYVAVFKTVDQALSLPFYLDIQFINTANNESVQGITIYGIHQDSFIKVNEENSNFYLIIYRYHFKIYSYNLPQPSTMITTKLNAYITDVVGINSQTVTLQFIEDPGFLIDKGFILLNTTKYFRLYGTILTVSSSILTIDLLFILKMRKKGQKQEIMRF